MEYPCKGGNVGGARNGATTKGNDRVTSPHRKPFWVVFQPNKRSELEGEEGGAMGGMGGPGGKKGAYLLRGWGRAP